MSGIKKGFHIFLTSVMILSFSSGIFAGTGNIIFYDKNYSKEIVSSVPDDAVQIVIESKEDSFEKGDTFSVNFKIANNLGFSSYGFNVEYDGTVIEPVLASSDRCAAEYFYNSRLKNKAIEKKGLKNAIKNKKENNFAFSGFCMGGSGVLAAAKGNGLLFTVDFKVIGEGTSMIDLSGQNDFLLSDQNGEKIPVYVKSFIITAKNPEKAEETQTDSEGGAENTTEKDSGLSSIKNIKKDEEDEASSESTEDGGRQAETYQEFTINKPKNAQEPVQFKDMAAYPWANEAVSFLSSLGIVKGSEWRIFKPGDFITRADFMVIVKRFTGIEGEPKLDVYEDVSASDYYAEAVGVVSRYGILDGINGMDGGYFKPKENITRQEVSAILAKVIEKAGKLETSDPSRLNEFTDGDFVSPYAREYMADLIGMGIIHGNDKKRLNPTEPITRAEVCVMVKRVYDLI